MNIDSHESMLDLIPKEKLGTLIESGQIYYCNYSKNEIIHFENDRCDQIEIIVDGKITVERIGIDGDLLTATTFTNSQILGANLIFSNINKYPMTVRAVNTSKVMIIERDILFNLCKTYPEFLLAFVKVISDLSVKIAIKMKNRVSRTIRDSIITYIKFQYQEQGSLTIELTMKKKALAEQFGISRTSLSRELKKMKDDHLIDFDISTITIIDRSIVNDK